MTNLIITNVIKGIPIININILKGVDESLSMSGKKEPIETNSIRSDNIVQLDKIPKIIALAAQIIPSMIPTDRCVLKLAIVVI